MNISEQELTIYLESLSVSSQDFKLDEEMTLFFVENLEKSTSWTYLAGDIARIPNKSSQLLDSIHKKILQCLLEINGEVSFPYTGILTGFFNYSRSGYSDYVLYLENLLSHESKHNKEEYLKSIALSPPRTHSQIFSLEDKIRIHSAKYLLMFDANHPMATRFFRDYPI